MNAVSFSSSRARHWFWIVILLHTLLWTLGPALTRPSLPHDTLEGIAWGMQWQWGYNKHPFLSAWLSALVAKFSGTSDWPIYLLAQVSVSLTFLAVWQLAKKMLEPLPALLAVLVLEGVLFYNINSFNFTPDSLQLPLWALLTLSFYRAVKFEKIGDWLLAGLLAALCLMTKYQGLVLLACLLAFTLIYKPSLALWKTPGPYAALLVCALALIPHGIWLVHHDFLPFQYAVNTPSEYTGSHSWLGHLLFPSELIINSLGSCAGLFLLLWPFYRGEKQNTNLASLDWYFLLIVGLGPFILTLILCTILGDHFPPRWTTPYFSLLGLFMMTVLKPQFTRRQCRQFAYSFAVFSLLLLTARLATFTVYPRLHSDAFLPNRMIATDIEQLWKKHYTAPLPYVAGSHYLVALVLPYLASHPQPFFSWSPKESPWIDEKHLREKGAVFIWDAGKNYAWDASSLKTAEIPKAILNQYPELQDRRDLLLPRLLPRSADQVQIGIAILPPEPKSSTP